MRLNVSIVLGMRDARGGAMRKTKAGVCVGVLSLALAVAAVRSTGQAVGTAGSAGSASDGTAVAS